MALAESISNFLQSDRARCDVDHAGDLTVWDAEDDGPAVIVIVEPVIDALKEVVVGRVAGSLDREGLWEVAGLSVDRETAGSIPDHVGSTGDWIDYFREMGIPMEVIVKTGGREAPNT